MAILQRYTSCNNYNYDYAIPAVILSILMEPMPLIHLILKQK